MKNYYSLMVLVMAITTTLMITSCQKESDDSVSTNASTKLDWRANQNAIVYPPNSHPYGKSYGEWGAAFWEWAFGIGCATNPIFDQDGSDQDQNQSGPVYFLAGNTGGVVTRDVTIPAGKSIFLPLNNYLNDFPCPDTSFHPAPGESLEHFLASGAIGFIDLVDVLTAELDGIDLTNLTSYRATSPIFEFTASPDLATCADPCVTGTEQQGVTDGYWLMLKPLSVGEHTLHFRTGIDAFGYIVDVTYNITIE